ncbi:MAG: hypothetical protein ACI8Y7_000257 [Candidatus Woesearchaeota archaeon]|jgi:hypothetical protein
MIPNPQGYGLLTPQGLITPGSIQDQQDGQYITIDPSKRTEDYMTFGVADGVAMHLITPYFVQKQIVTHNDPEALEMKVPLLTQPGTLLVSARSGLIHAMIYAVEIKEDATIGKLALGNMLNPK